MSNKRHKSRKSSYPRKKQYAIKKVAIQTPVNPKAIKSIEFEFGQGSITELASNITGQTQSSILNLEKQNIALLKIIAKLCVGIWRINNLLTSQPIADDSVFIKKVSRTIESLLNLLNQSEFKVRDFKGQPYVEGMSINVLAWQPIEGLKKNEILETVKPMIQYKNQIIDFGEFIVGYPKTTELPGKIFTNPIDFNPKNLKKCFSTSQKPKKEE